MIVETHIIGLIIPWVWSFALTVFLAFAKFKGPRGSRGEDGVPGPTGPMGMKGLGLTPEIMAYMEFYIDRNLSRLIKASKTKDVSYETSLTAEALESIRKELGRMY